MLVLLFVVSSFAGNRKDKLLEIERDVKSNLAVLQNEMGKGSYADLDKVRSALATISKACLELKSYGIALQADCADQRQSAKDLRDSERVICSGSNSSSLSGGRGNSSLKRT